MRLDEKEGNLERGIVRKWKRKKHEENARIGDEKMGEWEKTREKRDEKEEEKKIKILFLNVEGLK